MCSTLCCCVGFTIFGDTSLSLRPFASPLSPARNDLRRAARFKSPIASLSSLRSRIARDYGNRGIITREVARRGETLLVELEKVYGGFHRSPSSVPLITPAKIRSFVSFAMVTRPDAAACHSKDDNVARAFRSNLRKGRRL